MLHGQQQMVATHMAGVGLKQGWQVLLTTLKLGTCIEYLHLARLPVGTLALCITDQIVRTHFSG
jgi:hypothetical protein